MRQAQIATLVSFILIAIPPALAQAPTPSPAPGPGPVPAGGITDWWWIILVILLVGVAIWYFTRGRRP